MSAARPLMGLWGPRYELKPARRSANGTLAPDADRLGTQPTAHAGRAGRLATALPAPHGLQLGQLLPIEHFLPGVTARRAPAGTLDKGAVGVGTAREAVALRELRRRGERRRRRRSAGVLRARVSSRPTGSAVAEDRRFTTTKPRERHEQRHARQGVHSAPSSSPRSSWFPAWTRLSKSPTDCRLLAKKTSLRWLTVSHGPAAASRSSVDASRRVCIVLPSR
jgi:hypothetical protein